MKLLDHTLQRSLLVALVLMETALVAIAIAVLYREFGLVLEANLYRIHFSGQVSMLALLVEHGAPVLAGMLAFNALALLAADRIWAFYVAGIVRELGAVLTAARKLEFGARAPGNFHHAVLEHAYDWQAQQAHRLAAVRARIAALPDTMPADPAERAALAQALTQLRDD